MSEKSVTFTVLRDVMDGLDPQAVEQIAEQIKQDIDRLNGRLTQSARLLETGKLLDFTLLGRHLHELRGLALTLGASDLIQSCLQAERHANERDRSELSGAIKAVLAETQRASDTLRAEFSGVAQ